MKNIPGVFKARILNYLTLTRKQRDFLDLLIRERGKLAYLKAKIKAGIKPDRLLNELSVQEASALIAILKENGHER